jgi:tetratricopeptide (TPR) repeat protein
MAAKHKKRKQHLHATSLLEQVERLLAKGNCKQALKEAKFAYRQQSDDEHCRLLQRAYLARAQELHRFGLREECRAVVEDLLELRVTDPAVEQALPDLLVAIGMFGRQQAASNTPASATSATPSSATSATPADPRLLSSAADYAVLRPDEAPASLPEIRPGAITIRTALSALETGDEAAALATVKDIARGSPFADWKLFVRGLAAYYRKDTAEMPANWDRLEPARFAARIAAVLKALRDPSSADRGNDRLKASVRKIEQRLSGSSVLTHLHALQRHITADRWDKVLQGLSVCQAALREFDPQILQRVSSLLYGEIVHKGRTAALAQLARIAEPLALDPNWNRAWAIVWEHPANSKPEQAESHWRKYVADLDQVTALSATERDSAKALVWLRVGGHLAEDAKYLADSPYDVNRADSPNVYARAFDCFSEALMLAPKLLPAYEVLAAAQQAAGKPDEAAETYRQLLEHHPDNIDALQYLVQHYQRRDEPLAAREFAFRVQRLRPLDKSVNNLVWRVHVATARHYACQQRWEEGRAEFAAADKLDPSLADAYDVLARKALLELKAGDMGLGQQLIQRATTQAGEAAPVLLVLAVESIRFGLSKQVQRQFDKDWIAALKKKCRSDTAGRMCEALASYLVGGVEYPRRVVHIEMLTEYVRRCSRVKWTARDLRHVCEFLDVLYLHEMDEDTAFELLDKLVEKGCKEFPGSAYFQFTAGELEFRQDPGYCDRRLAHKCFERALEFAKASSDPLDVKLVELAKERLTFLGEAGLERPAFPFGPAYYDDDDDDAFDDGEFDDGGDTFADAPPVKMFNVFAKMCEKLGIDPEEILNRSAAGEPIFGGGKASSAQHKRKR